MQRSPNPAPTYRASDFSRRIAEIEKNPSAVRSKVDLVQLWRLALIERNRNKQFQAEIASDAARTIGEATFRHTESDPYQAVILQFLWMDHMHDEDYDDEADREWTKLASMLDRLVYDT